MFSKTIKLTDMPTSKAREWYNRLVEAHAWANVLDVGKSKHWDYGFPTLDIDPSMNPTYIGDIQKTLFRDGCFDVVLCNGLYEWVESPQKMIDEVLRITKGIALFGFVGPGYKPYKKPWRCYEGKETIPARVSMSLGNEYYFFLCDKTWPTSRS